MSIIWKPGDRAVFGYRPPGELPSGAVWDNEALNHVGHTGTIAGSSFDYRRITRIPFQEDAGGLHHPMIACLFPVIEQPPRTVERERELVLK